MNKFEKILITTLLMIRGFESPTRGFESPTRGFESPIRGFESLTRGFEPAIREIAFSGEKNYNLCYAKRIISSRILYA
jgi:hypothetical protein